jgi:branched-chain amino acid transport system ATP-binding protein
MADAPIVELRNLSVGYSGVPVVSDLDVTVAAGEVVAMLGPNGAGKTTILHTIAGLLRPIAGQVLFDGRPLSGELHARARRGIALVTEERAVIRRLSAEENLRLGTRNVPLALTLFPELRPLLRRKAGLLSGGEQQMLVLARVLANRSRLLLVDEVSFGLGPLIVKRLLGALREAANNGAAVLMVEQHPAMALQISDRGLVLSHGRVQLEGPGPELLSRLPEIEEAYLAVVARGAVDRSGPSTTD